MYETKEMNYNTKEKPIYSCKDKYLSKKNVTKVNCIEQLSKSCNKEVFLSNTVILLTFEEYVSNC